MTENQPSQADIFALRAYLDMRWSLAWARMDTVDTYVQRTFPVWPKRQVNSRYEYHPATAKAVVDHAADAMLAFTPKWHREPLGDGEAHQTKADHVEEFLSALFTAADRQEMTAPLAVMKRNLVTYGYCSLYGMVPAWDNAAKGEAAETPMRLRAPHPRTVLLDPLDKQPREGLVRQMFTGRELEALTQRKKQAKVKGRRIFEVYDPGEQPYKAVPCLEYWSWWPEDDDGWHALLVEGGQLLYIEKNPLGYLPLAHAFSGWGQMPGVSTGVSTSNTASGLTIGNDPMYLCEGILQPVLESLLKEAQEASAKHVALVEGAFAKVLVKGQDAAEAANQWARSDIIEGDFEWMPPQQIAPGLFEISKETRSDIEHGTLSRSLGGERADGVSTVGQQAILDTAANRKFDIPLRQMEQLATIVGSNALRLAERMIEAQGSALVCDGHELKAEDIAGDYNLRAEFKVVDPVLRLQERQMAMAEHQAKLIGRKQYWRAAGYEDTTEIDEALLDDLINEDPAVQAAMVAARERLVGLDKLKQQFEAQQAGQGAQPAMQGPGVEPGMMPESAPQEQPTTPVTARSAGAAVRQISVRAATPNTLVPRVPMIPRGARP